MSIHQRECLKIAVGVALAIIGPTAGAGGQQPGGPMPPMGQAMPGGMGMRMGAGPMMGRPFAPPQMAVTNEYVYVLRGNTLFQLATRDLTQIRTLTLPGEQPPRGMPGMPGMMPGLPPAAPDGRGGTPPPDGANPSAPTAPDPGAQAPNAPQEPQDPGFGDPQIGPGMQGPGGPMGMGPGMPGMPGQMGMPPFAMAMGAGMQPSLAANGEFAFVLRGNTLFQISAKTMQIVKRAELPDEWRGMPGFGPAGGPGMGGPQGPGGQGGRRGGGRPPQ